MRRGKSRRTPGQGLHIDSRSLRPPSSIPTVSQATISQRWSRFSFQRPTTGTWFMTTSTVWQSIFGSTVATARGSYLYIHKIRVWLESGGTALSTLIMRVPPYAGLTVLAEGSPVAYYRDDGEAGKEYACIEVDMAHIWKIQPVGPGYTAIVFNIDTASLTDPVTAAVTNAPTVTVDVLCRIHANSLPLATYTELPHDFESLSLEAAGAVVHHS